MYTTIITLYQQVISQCQIAKLTKYDRKTIKKIINEFDLCAKELPRKYERKSGIGNWHENILRL